MKVLYFRDIQKPVHSFHREDDINRIRSFSFTMITVTTLQIRRCLTLYLATPSISFLS